MAKIKVQNAAMSVEEIAFKHLTNLFPNNKERAAQLSGYVEEIYEINPGLAGSGQLIAIGTIVEMPQATNEVKIIKPNRLWG